MLLKHLKKNQLKTLENHCKYTQHPIKYMQRMCETYEHPDKHACNMRPENTDKTLVTDLCNVRVQPLQHMQHPDLLYPSETLATYL
jgi:hypothetical protein